MTDTPPPKRRFWQIHLSTAVVMMLMTGASGYYGFPDLQYLYDFAFKNGFHPDLGVGTSLMELLALFAVVAATTYVFEWWIRQDSPNRRSKP